MKKILIGIVLSVLIAPLNAGAESPYKGQQVRAIKALSQADMASYLSGKGMGLAKVAELNNYPGPLHVIDLTEDLNLTEVQINKTKILFNRMQANAIKIGKQIINKERKLEQLFATSAVNSEILNRILLEIGSLQAQLRYVHLSAHLEQKQLLTKHQVMLYQRLRGYDSGSHDNHHHSH